MKTSIKVTLVAAALCIAGLYLYGGPDTEPPPAFATENETVASVEASHVDPNKKSSVRERVVAEATTPEPPQLTHPYELVLAVHVVDEFGVPVSGFRPELGPLGGALRGASETTDGHGNAVIRWPSRMLVTAVEMKDPRGHRRRVTLRHGSRTDVTLIGGGQQSFTISFSSTNEFRLISNDLTQRLLAGSATSHQMTNGLHPHAVFSEEGLVAVVPEPVVDPKATDTGLNDVVLGQIVSYYSGEFLNVGISAGELTGFPAPKIAAANCSIEGIVYDETGKPARNIPVALFGKGPQPLHRMKTNKLGEFRFHGPTANTLEVRAGGTEQGLQATSVRVDSGNYVQNLQLQPEACIRGSLHDQAEQPVANAVIEWLSDDGLWADRTKTNNDGTFVLANMPNKPGQLYAWHQDKKWRLPVAQAEGVLPDSGTVGLTCDLGQSSALRVQPQAPDGCDLADLRLRVRQVDTGFSRGIGVPRVSSTTTNKNGVERTTSLKSPESPWELESLPPGFYDVEMWLPGCGSKNLGRHWLDGKVDTDLGTVALAHPGLVHFEVPEARWPEDLKVEISQLREPFDLRIESLPTLVNDVRMAEGNYVLATQRGKEPPRFQTFTVKSNATTVLQVNW